MTAYKVVQRWNIALGHLTHHRSPPERMRRAVAPHVAPGTNRDLVWVGGLSFIALAVAMLAVTASSSSRVVANPPILAAEQSTEMSPASARTSCLEIGESDLQSPTEGLWFQSNCVAGPDQRLTHNVSCNRTSLSATEFVSIGSGLYVYRQASSSPGYVWYASSDSCYDLVSARIVTAVCADQTVTFSWKADPCSAHGGVLAWVNSR